jgi:hypothetical protein
MQILKLSDSDIGHTTTIALFWVISAVYMPEEKWLK